MHKTIDNLVFLPLSLKGSWASKNITMGSLQAHTDIGPVLIDCVKIDGITGTENIPLVLCILNKDCFSEH